MATTKVTVKDKAARFVGPKGSRRRKVVLAIAALAIGFIAYVIWNRRNAAEDVGTGEEYPSDEEYFDEGGYDEGYLEDVGIGSDYGSAFDPITAPGAPPAGGGGGAQDPSKPDRDRDRDRRKRNRPKRNRRPGGGHRKRMRVDADKVVVRRPGSNKRRRPGQDRPHVQLPKPRPFPGDGDIEPGWVPEGSGRRRGDGWGGEIPIGRRDGITRRPHRRGTRARR